MCDLAAGLFLNGIKKKLANISKYFCLETVHSNTSNLFRVDGDVSGKKFFAALRRGADGF